MSFPLALPKSLLSDIAATSAGITSQWVKIQPNNVSQVVSNATPVLASSTDPTIITLGSQQLNFDLPTGQGANVFCDTAKSTISFRVKYSTLATPTTGYSGTTAFLQSSAHSFIERMTTYVAGTVIDDCVGLSTALDEENGWKFDVSQRDVLFNMGFRGEQIADSAVNYNQGHPIPVFAITGTPSASSNTFSYEIPFVNSLFGVGCKSMVNIGRLAKSSVSIYTPQNAPVTILNAAAGLGAGGSIQITIDQISINLFTLTLDEVSMKLLSPQKEQYIAGMTYRVGNGAINSGSQGAISVQVPIRVRSARSLATRFSESVIKANGSLNSYYDAKMVLANSLNYFIGSTKRVPSVPHNCLVSPSTIYSRAIMANFETTYESWKQKSSNISGQFYKYVETVTPPTVTEVDKLVFDAGSGTVTGNLASFSFCEDLRCASSANYMSGSDLTLSNSFLELSIVFPPKNNLYVTFIAKADIIFVILPDGSVESRV